VLDQLRQTVEHLATVHVEFFVYVPEKKKLFISFLSILAIFSSFCVITIEIFSGTSQMDFWENKNLNFLPVLRIHVILERIRIRVSIPLTNGSWSGSCFFRQWPSRRQQKILFSSIFLKVHLHHFSKIKSHKEVTKQ
jgi:hypothetical protein